MADAQWTTPGSGERPSIGELFSRLSEQSSQLVRAEIELAKAELAQKAKASAIGIGLFVAAGLLAFFAFAVLIATAILGLAEAVPAWLAALIIGVALLVVTAILALVGKKSLDRGLPPTPERTTENVKQDVTAIKEGLRS
ncbi:phage holin family protein [Pengzhenrongella sicca]|uniref:Phage holin family protein n=1 Tax=Pengzhenrongella sicca TaxID=2819238 RepID=A0A8A4ZGR2_9MICO|nr:phage holin family protein [Pengzhenrongella sicca]QTE29677.1 phage holin family protein [Pengzhenrongella sicca]